MRPYRSGFSLTEVLVSVFVLAVGVIGVAGMQTSALRMAQQSSHQSVALELAEEMAEEIRASTANFPAAGAQNPFIGLDYRSTSEDSSPGANCIRSDADCSPQSLVAFDIGTWRKRLRTALPPARVVVCRDSSPWSDEAREFDWACNDDAGAPLVIKIGWQERGADGRLLRNQAGEFPPAVVLAVPSQAA